MLRTIEPVEASELARLASNVGSYKDGDFTGVYVKGAIGKWMCGKTHGEVLCLQ